MTTSTTRFQHFVSMLHVDFPLREPNHVLSNSAGLIKTRSLDYWYRVNGNMIIRSLAGPWLRTLMHEALPSSFIGLWHGASRSNGLLFWWSANNYWRRVPALRTAALAAPTVAHVGKLNSCDFKICHFGLFGFSAFWDFDICIFRRLGHFEILTFWPIRYFEMLLFQDLSFLHFLHFWDFDKFRSRRCAHSGIWTGIAKK